MVEKYFIFLILTLFLQGLHFVFSKRMARPKPENFKPPRSQQPLRSGPLYFISEDFCFLSVTFTFFFLNDLLYYIKGQKIIPNEVREIIPYVLWFLIMLVVAYVACLSLNRKIDCIKYELSQNKQSRVAKIKYLSYISGSILLSLAALAATFSISLKITFKLP
jgi:hypothetical protein